MKIYEVSVNKVDSDHIEIKQNDIGFGEAVIHISSEQADIVAQAIIDAAEEDNQVIRKCDHCGFKITLPHDSCPYCTDYVR